MDVSHGAHDVRRYGVPQRLSESSPDLRASDAERRAVADELAKHFTEGRLDQLELDERLDRALRAKTRGQLARPLADLPRLTPERHGGSVAARPRILLATLFLLAMASTAAVATDHAQVLLAVVLGLLFWRRRIVAGLGHHVVHHLEPPRSSLR